MLAEQPFIAAPIGDEPAASELARRLASSAGLPAPELHRAAMNATYLAGDVVIRVGRVTVDARTAYDLADSLLAAGIRVPRPAARRPVVVDDDARAATAWERIEAAGPVDWSAVGEMVARLHRLDPDAVAGRYPTPPAAALPWWQFARTLDAARPLLDERAYEALAEAVERGRDRVPGQGGAERLALCHGDVHQHNVVFAPDGPVIVDWDLLCLGPLEWDHAPLRAMAAHWGADAAWYRSFADGADEALDAGLVESLTELRAVAATLLRVLAEGPERRPDSEAERRLRFWRGDHDAPPWIVV